WLSSSATGWSSTDAASARLFCSSDVASSTRRSRRSQRSHIGRHRAGGRGCLVCGLIWPWRLLSIVISPEGRRVEDQAEWIHMACRRADLAAAKDTVARAQEGRFVPNFVPKQPCNTRTARRMATRLQPFSPRLRRLRGTTEPGVGSSNLSGRAANHLVARAGPSPRRARPNQAPVHAQCLQATFVVTQPREACSREQRW